MLVTFITHCITHFSTELLYHQVLKIIWYDINNLWTQSIAEEQNTQVGQRSKIHRRPKMQTVQL